MKTLLLIYNPHSGLQTISKNLHKIVDIYTASGWDVIAHPSQSGEDIFDTAKRLCQKVDRVVAAGGDGTLNSTINGLMAAGLQKPFGYIPCGSTNDFSHSLGIPTKLTDAAKNSVEGAPFAYDVGCMNGRYFSYVTGFGAFTDVTYTTPQETKNALGYFAYLISGAASLPNIVPYRASFESAERSGEGEYVLGLVTNTLQVGGMKNLLPKDIALNDGLFEVILVKNPKNPLDLNKILSSVMKKDYAADCFEYFKTAEVTFRSEKPLAWTIDGENGGAFYETKISCIKQALSIITKNG